MRAPAFQAVRASHVGKITKTKASQRLCGRCGGPRGERPDSIQCSDCDSVERLEAMYAREGVDPALLTDDEIDALGDAPGHKERRNIARRIARRQKNAANERHAVRLAA